MIGFRTQIKRLCLAGPSWTQTLLLMTVCLVAGCEQPIYKIELSEDSLPAIQFEPESDNARFSWPVYGTTLAVTKPPPLPYLTDIGKKFPAGTLTSPDPPPWQSEDHSDRINHIRDYIFKPFSTSMSAQGRIQASKLTGPQAFDLNASGDRLVTIASDGLSLYRAPSGKLVGSLNLPGKWSVDKPMAIRFAPQTNDFLVASQSQLLRISSKDGNAVAQTRGPGEPIQKWLVADDESFMVMLTESGKLFGGDAKLGDFGPLQLGGANKDQTFTDFGLSPDGIRLLVVVRDQPRTYLIDNGRVVDFVRHDEQFLDEVSAITAGRRDDVWICPTVSFVSQAGSGPNSDGEYDPDASRAVRLAAAFQRRPYVHPMFWKTKWLNSCRNPDRLGEWTLALSQRWIDGNWQWVLHDLNVNMRDNSVARVLDERPERIVVDREMNCVAIMNQDSLELSSWAAWQGPSLDELEDPTKYLFSRADPKELAALLSILHDNDHWTQFGSSQDVIDRLVRWYAQEWAAWEMKRYQETLDAKQKTVLARIDRWVGEGGFWARTIHAEMMLQQAGLFTADQWDNGRVDFSRYSKMQKTAHDALRSLVSEDRPTAFTFARYIQIYLGQGGEFAEIDGLCRRCLTLHPRSTVMPAAVGSLLSPEMYGETGDMMAFLVSHCRLIEAPLGDLMFAKTVGQCSGVLNSDPGNWQSINVDMLDRGIDYAIANNLAAEDWFKRLIIVYDKLGLGNDQIDRMNRYLTEACATEPANVTAFGSKSLLNEQEQWRQILEEAENEKAAQ